MELETVRRALHRMASRSDSQTIPPPHRAHPHPEKTKQNKKKRYPAPYLFGKSLDVTHIALSPRTLNWA